MIDYCLRIEDSVRRCGGDYEVFARDHLFHDACCMCVIQIGELSSQLSENVKSTSPSIPWRIIKDTRNFYVHSYGDIDLPAVWDTLQEDIPELKRSCEALLARDE